MFGTFFGLLLDFWVIPGFLGAFFWAILRCLGIIFWLFPDFWVKFDFLKNNPDFWIFILIFY